MPATDGTKTKQVNGTSKDKDKQLVENAVEKDGEQATTTEEPTAAAKREIESVALTEAQSKAPEDAPKDDTADVSMPDPVPDSMDVDVSTERPNLESSAAPIDSTQNNTSALSDAAIPSSSNDSTQSADISKLEIKATQETEDVSPTQADVTMAEAAPSPGKVSRSREDDDIEEPAAKRAKTEDATEAVADSLVVANNPPASDAPTPQAGADGLDSAIPDSLPIIPFQNRKLREVLGNVKKTKNGGNFKKSVQDLWPALWNDYRAKIDNPVDISLMEARLREDKYANYGEFKADLNQLYENAVTFNGANHDVSLAAAQVRDYILVRMPEIIQSKPPAKPEKGKAHPTRYTEPRVTTQPRRQSQSQSQTQAPLASPKAKADASSLPTPASATAQAFAIPPSGIPQIRRDSTREDHDRPKRPIHPPKNRDPEYASKANRKKKLDPEQRFIDWALEEVKKVKHYAINQWFMAPVDPVALNIPNYFKIIKKPMDLGTMTEKNYDGEYKNIKDVEKDIKLIIRNSELFNGADHEVTSQARLLEELLKSQLAQKDSWIERHYPSAAPSAIHASAASPEHSNAESEDESDGEGNEEDSDAIQSLQQRLNEEQEKLNKLLNSKKPDLTMMEVQQSMVTMLQRKLVEEKTKSHSEKKPKSKKKSSSKSKSKAAANGLVGGNKRSSGSANTFKKPSNVSKKAPQPKKRVIGAMEKAVIADGINELDGYTLTRAVEIIKKDTGQAVSAHFLDISDSDSEANSSKENDEGEMELDIDSLTSDALGKLYDLINKSHPHIRQAVAKRPEFSGQLSPDSETKAKAGGLPAKPKKNKPMNKHEQERKIEQLRELKAQLQRGGSASQEPTPGTPEVQAGDTSEESDSEEE